MENGNVTTRAAHAQGRNHFSPGSSGWNCSSGSVMSLDQSEARSSATATLLDTLDISLKTRQELMPHSDQRLTMNRYTRADVAELNQGQRSYPCRFPFRPAPNRSVWRLRGSDFPSVPLPASSLVVPARIGTSGSRLRSRHAHSRNRDTNRKNVISHGFQPSTRSTNFRPV
jgi:hypothetical protein